MFYMESDDVERWVIVGRGRDSRTVRRSETIARIRLTEGGLYQWRLLTYPDAYGTRCTVEDAAKAARQAWLDIRGGLGVQR